MNSLLVIVAHNIRSAHNIGSLFRTAEGLGVDKIYLTGYTPYPEIYQDTRLPHDAKRTSKLINKTALGAEALIDWEYNSEIKEVFNILKSQNYKIAGLEQVKDSVLLNNLKPPPKLAIVLGNEVNGIDQSIQKLLDFFIEIPMKGRKESFNVTEAATMVMYHCKYVNL